MNRAVIILMLFGVLTMLNFVTGVYVAKSFGQTRSSMLMIEKRLDKTDEMYKEIMQLKDEAEYGYYIFLKQLAETDQLYGEMELNYYKYLRTIYEGSDGKDIE